MSGRRRLRLVRLARAGAGDASDGPSGVILWVSDERPVVAPGVGWPP